MEIARKDNGSLFLLPLAPNEPRRLRKIVDTATYLAINENPAYIGQAVFSLVSSCNPVATDGALLTSSSGIQIFFVPSNLSRLRRPSLAPGRDLLDRARLNENSHALVEFIYASFCITFSRRLYDQMRISLRSVLPLQLPQWREIFLLRSAG